MQDRMSDDQALGELTRYFHDVIARGSADVLTVSSVEGIFLFVSPASRDLFGWEPAAMVGQRDVSFLHPNDVALLGAAFRDGAVVRAPSVTATFRVRCADASYAWVEAASQHVDTPSGPLIVSSLRNINRRMAAELDLRRLASTDALTGLANRTTIVDSLKGALARLNRQGGLVAVLILDIDRFKVINDSLGHLPGDAILRQIADRLHGLVRPQDTVGRLGGDEFAVIVDSMTWSEEAHGLAARIISACRVPFEVDGKLVACTASIGMTLTPSGHDRPETLLTQADVALYRAKREGRDRVAVFDEELRSRVVDRLVTERMLRRAIDDRRINVAFQPIVDIKSGRIVSAEALARIRPDGDGPLVEAQSFVTVAAEAGLLAEVDDQVLTIVLDQAGAWGDLLDTTGFDGIAINMSARRLSETDFAEEILRALRDRHLRPGMLHLDLTEKQLRSANSSVITRLQSLRDAGLEIGLDNFGTGWSSVSFLRSLPLDYLKMDGSFVRAIAVDPTDRAIASSIVQLAHALGIMVIAEAVEEESQLQALVETGCDRAQGSLFGAPGTARVIERLVLGRPYESEVLREA
jgi:diguanylate cyclase (GGDEF)-like protein/PAS domain S-box-containing protein